MKTNSSFFSRLLILVPICFLLTSCQSQRIEPAPSINSPSISSLDIPEQAVDYPDDWPIDLQFPIEFTLVESNSGESVGGSSHGWTAMYRLDDSVDEAESILRKHFTDSGWEIPVVEKQDENGYTFLLEKGESNGFIVIEADPDKRNQTLIMATFFK